MVRTTVILAIARAIVYYLILSRIYQTPFSSKRTNISSRQTTTLFFVMSDNLMDVTRTVPDGEADVGTLFSSIIIRWPDYLTWSSIVYTGGTHFCGRCQEVHRTGRDIIIHLQISRPSGGESGIRTHGTVRYHWFSRPAP